MGAEDEAMKILTVDADEHGISVRCNERAVGGLNEYLEGGLIPAILSMISRTLAGDSGIDKANEYLRLAQEVPPGDK